jgi:translation initiation factor 5
MDTINLTTNEYSLSDSDYRYKLEKPVTDIGGKKGNKTTYIYNSESIAKYLNIDSMCFGKYLGYNMSCPLFFNKEFKCLSFKGEHSNEKIIKLLIEFINIYILCPVCDLPETSLHKNKQLGIYHECRSCGNNTKIKITKIDKTYEYIEKNIK